MIEHEQTVAILVGEIGNEFNTVYCTTWIVLRMPVDIRLYGSNA